MIEKISLTLPQEKSLYFASDFHLGAEGYPHLEKQAIEWLRTVEDDCYALFLLGDVFDFWFEYRKVIPKGFIRFQGKLAEMADAGIAIHMFAGNHDMWMNDYFTKEIGAVFHKGLLEINCNDQQFLVGHGDGLGPGDRTYKVLKIIFTNRLCRWMFRWLHPDWGVALAHKWSKSSRLSHTDKESLQAPEDEWLWQYCEQSEKNHPHDAYIFGHRHLVMDQPVGEKGRYLNLGDWANQPAFAKFDGNQLTLKKIKVS